jgi:hypothetical protein
MKIPKSLKIKNCRLCNSDNLKKIYSFGNLFISNFVTKKLYPGLLVGEVIFAIKKI